MITIDGHALGLAQKHGARLHACPNPSGHSQHECFWWTRDDRTFYACTKCGASGARKFFGHAPAADEHNRIAASHRHYASPVPGCGCYACVEFRGVGLVRVSAATEKQIQQLESAGQRIVAIFPTEDGDIVMRSGTNERVRVPFKWLEMISLPSIQVGQFQIEDFGARIVVGRSGRCRASYGAHFLLGTDIQERATKQAEALYGLFHEAQRRKRGADTSSRYIDRLLAPTPEPKTLREALGELRRAAHGPGATMPMHEVQDRDAETTIATLVHTVDPIPHEVVIGKRRYVRVDQEAIGEKVMQCPKCQRVFGKVRAPTAIKVEPVCAGCEAEGR